MERVTCNRNIWVTKETYKYLPTPSAQGGERYVTYSSCFSLPSLKAWQFQSRPFPACALGVLRSRHSRKRLAHLREHRLLSVVQNLGFHHVPAHCLRQWLWLMIYPAPLLMEGTEKVPFGVMVV